jgi:hypothetical protein
MRKYKIINKALIFIIILLLLYIAANYLLNFFLPQKIMAATKKFAQETLENKIEISQLRINIIDGITLSDVSLYQKGENIPYLKIKKVRAIPSYAALISAKKLIVSLKANGIKFLLKRNQNGEFNLPRLKQTIEPPAVKKQDIKPDKFLPEKIPAKEPLLLIKDISLKGVTVDFQDETVNFRKSFADISIDANLYKFPKIIFKAEWPGKLSLKGEYSGDTNYIKASCLIKEMALADFNSYCKNFGFQGGNIQEAELNLEGKDNYVIKGNLKIIGMLAAYPLTNPDTTKNIPSQLKGDFNLVTELKFNKESFSYHIAANLLKGKVANLPVTGILNNINANLTLDNGKFEFNDLSADFVFNAPGSQGVKPQVSIGLQAKGEILFKESLFYCEITTHPKLKEFIAAAKAIKPFQFDYQDGGDILLKAIIKGNLEQKNLDYYTEYNIQGALFKQAKSINAGGFFTNDKLILKECSLNYKNIPVKINGQLENFALPAFSINADSELGNITLKAKYANDNIDIDAVTWKMADSKMAAQGNIENKTGGEAKLQGMTKIDFKDLLKILKLLDLKYPFLEKMSPQGIFEAKFIIERAKDTEGWQLKLAGLSDEIKLYGIAAKQIQIELYRDKKELVISPLIAEVCGGKLDLRIKTDSLNNKVLLNVLINDLELSRLRQEINLKNSNLSGILSLDAKLENDGLSQWNKMTGNGKVTIKEGNIWEINFLKGLGQFLFIPEFESIVFEEGYSDLLFKDENIIFENTELKSTKMTLRGQGRISTKGDLNFILVSEFNPNLISASESLNKIISSILSKNTLAIELNGTLAKPTYKIKPTVFSNFEGIKDLLEGILK